MYKREKNFLKDALDKLTIQSIVASKTFCPLTVKYHLDFNGADYILPLFEREVISHQPKTIQEAYKKVIRSFFINGEEWFALTKEDRKKFNDWTSPIIKSLQDSIESHNHGQYDSEHLTSITLILINIHQSGI